MWAFLYHYYWLDPFVAFFSWILKSKNQETTRAIPDLLVEKIVAIQDWNKTIKILSLEVSYLDILFSSNRNIHKSSRGVCFWASDPLINRFYWNLSIKGSEALSEAQKQRPYKLLWMLWFDGLY